MNAHVIAIGIVLLGVAILFLTSMKSKRVPAKKK
jgi:hypothetical protein